MPVCVLPWTQVYIYIHTLSLSVSVLEILKRFCVLHKCHDSFKILCDLLYSSDVAADTAFHTHTHMHKHTFSFRVIWSPWEMPDKHSSRMIGGGPLYFVNLQVQRIPYWEERVCVCVSSQSLVLFCFLHSHISSSKIRSSFKSTSLTSFQPNHSIKQSWLSNPTR